MNVKFLTTTKNVSLHSVSHANKLKIMQKIRGAHQIEHDFETLRQKDLGFTLFLGKTPSKITRFRVCFGRTLHYHAVRDDLLLKKFKEVVYFGCRSIFNASFFFTKQLSAA